MDTYFARNRLSAYLDGLLPPSEAREVAAAIERDPTLAAEFESMRQTVELLHQEGPAQAPTGFHARVMAKAAEHGRPSGQLIPIRRWLARVPVEAVALAAAAAVVVIAIQWRPNQQPLEPDDRDAVAAVAPPDVATLQDKTAPDGGLASGSAEPLPPALGEAPPDDGVAMGTSAKGAPEQKAGPPPVRYQNKASSRAGTDDAYVPEWEATTASSSVASVRGLRLDISNPEVLFQLETIARSSQGKLLDGQNRTMAPFTLTADSPSASVLLVVPADQADAVQSRLSSFGATEGKAPTGVMVGSRNAGFFVQVRWTQ